MYQEPAVLATFEDIELLADAHGSESGNGSFVILR